MYSIRIFDLENEGQGRWWFGWKFAGELTIQHASVYKKNGSSGSSRLLAMHNRTFREGCTYIHTYIHTSTWPAWWRCFNSVGMMKKIINLGHWIANAQIMMTIRVNCFRILHAKIAFFERWAWNPKKMPTDLNISVIDTCFRWHFKLKF